MYFVGRTNEFVYLRETQHHHLSSQQARNLGVILDSFLLLHPQL